MTDAFIVLTENKVDAYFDDKKDIFLQNFKEEEKRWTITLQDLVKIQDIEPSAFVKIKEDFIREIRNTKPTLDKFLNVCMSGIHLINPKVIKNYQKAMHHGEKENYFQNQLDDMFLDVFCGYGGSSIQQDASLKGVGSYSDYILYDSKDISNCVLVEYAANLPKGKKSDGVENTSSTIYGHLNRLSNTYNQKQIEFPGKRRASRTRSLKAECSKMWFIYFFHDYTKMKEIVEMVEKDQSYYILNVLLCHYSPPSENHLEKHLKISGKSSFVKL